MAVTQPRSADSDEVLALLAAAEAHIRTDCLAEAAEIYRALLAEPALADLPAARLEAQANYGALLLHEARTATDNSEIAGKLDQAIDLLTQARAGYRQRQSGSSGAISDTNLALAYFQRYLANGQQTDLMSAHLALDFAEVTAAPSDRDMRDWIHSIRQLLLDQVNRRAR